MFIEMCVRTGGDPRSFAEYQALQEELAKLSHPACPDIDWCKVERLCLELFCTNGAELQTVAAYTLARSHLRGARGISEGVGLLDMLICQWECVWPAAASVRAEILTQLFAQLQPLLRGLLITPSDLPELTRLDARMKRLDAIWAKQSQRPVITLQALRRQLSSLMKRVEQCDCEGRSPRQNRDTHASDLPARSFVMPVLKPAPPNEPGEPAERSRYRQMLCLSVALMVLTLTAWFGWQIWLADQPALAEIAKRFPYSVIYSHAPAH